MPASRLVTGTHTFTFPYRIDGGVAAEFECSCTYTVYRGRPAIHSPPPGEPAEPDEIRDITDIEVEVSVRLSDEERARRRIEYTVCEERQDTIALIIHKSPFHESNEIPIARDGSLVLVPTGRRVEIPRHYFEILSWCAEPPYVDYHWVAPDPALKEKIEQYLDNEGAEALLERAAEAGETA